MKSVSFVMKWFLVSQWDRWHQAKQGNSTPAMSETPRQVATISCANGFNGLIERGVPFQYDAQLGRWLFYSKTVES